MNEDGRDRGGSPGGKSWQRSWSTNEMRQNAHAWNLAGDAGLLKHLQELSQAVLARTHTTEKALDSLVEDVNMLTSDVNTTNNKFLCLANTQFVENRVYDDDEKETPQDELVAEKKSKEEIDDKILQKVREALSMSVAVLDTMFEPVEIQASDSEGESETDRQGTKTLLLEPHNPYIHRPLPHLIGSEGFMFDDRIGLGDSPSDCDDSQKTGLDYDMEASSDSDVDFTPSNTSKRNQHTYSSQSSVSDHGPQPAESGKLPKTNKTVYPIQDNGDGGEEVLDQPPASSARQQAQDTAFADQLAAKLGKIALPVTNAESNMVKSSNYTKTTSDELFGGILSEHEDDALFTGSSGLFSGPVKLFDDLKDTNNSLWSPEPGSTCKILPAETEKTGQPAQMQTKPAASNLFASNVSDEEDDLFFIKSVKTPDTVPTHPESLIKKQSTFKHHLNAAEHRAGMPTSTPERGSKQVHAEERKTGLFGDVSGNPTKDVYEDVSRKVSAEGVDSSVNERPPSSSAMPKENPPTHDKKPTGGVLMFGQAHILAGLRAKLPCRPSSSSESSSRYPPEGNFESVPESRSIFPSVDQVSQESGNTEQGWNNGSSSHQHSQSAGIGFASPTLTSSILSKDNGYQTKTVSNSVPSIPTPSSQDDDSDDDIFAKSPSAFSSHYTHPASGGLFADLNDDEDDLFAVSPAQNRNKKKNTPDLSSRSASNNQLKGDNVKPPVTLNNKTEKLAHLNTSKTTTTINTSKSKSEKSYTHDIYSTVPPPLKSESNVKKPLSLFDDSDSGEDELLFSSASSGGSRRSQASTDILVASAASGVEKKPLSKKGLFDDDYALFGNARNDPDIDIFGPSKRPAPAQSSTILGASQLSSNPSLAEEDSSQNNDSLAVHSSWVLSFGNTSSTIPVTTSDPNGPKSLCQDDIFSNNDNDDIGNLFIKKSSAGTSSKSELFASSGSEDIVDNLFRDTSESCSKQKDQSERKLLPNASSSRQEGKESMSPHTVPTFNAPEARSPKPSLFGKSENNLETEKKMTEKNITDNNSSIESLSIRSEPPPPLNTEKLSRKPEPPRTLNIRKETDPRLGYLDASNDNDNIFSSSTKKATTSPKQSVKPTVAAKPVTTSFNKSQIPKVDNSDQHVGVSADQEFPRNRKPDTSEVDSAAISVFKLVGGNGQPALKIDPRALLPNQKPPPRQTASEQTPPMEAASGLALSDKKEPPAICIEKPVGFDQPVLNNSTLPSANKDRAKLGVKRRPPSNKARREAARASQNLDKSDKESPLSPDISSAVTDPFGALNTTSSVTSSNSFLSPSTDEDDVFGVPQDLPSEYGNQVVTSVDIFSGAPILSPIASMNTVSQPELNQTADSSGKKAEVNSSTLKDNPSLFLPSDAEKSSEELFSPACCALSVGLMNEQSVATGSNSPAVQKSSRSISEANVEKGDPIESAFATANISLPSAAAKQVTVDDTSLLFPSERSKEKSVTLARKVADCALKPTLVGSDNTPISAVKNIAIDPLNKLEEPSLNHKDETFRTANTAENIKDHSALFPFVKKKPEMKQVTKQPLFTQAPVLPSKADKSVTKPDLGGLDDVEDNDLFSSSSKTLSGKKTEVSKLKGKEAKPWNFSDEDDDDLFQSGGRQVPSNPSAKASASILSQSALLSSRDTVKSSKPTVPEVGVKKVKATQSGPKNRLFSDENTDDDLFSKPPQIMRTKLKEVPPKSSLFDDDDDDLFGSNQPTSRSIPGQSNPKPVPETSAQLSATSKLKKENVFNDPLMVLQSDD